MRIHALKQLTQTTAIVQNGNNNSLATIHRINLTFLAIIII